MYKEPCEIEKVHRRKKDDADALAEEKKSAYTCRMGMSNGYL